MSDDQKSPQPETAEAVEETPANDSSDGAASRASSSGSEPTINEDKKVASDNNSDDSDGESPAKKPSDDNDLFNAAGSSSDEDAKENLTEGQQLNKDLFGDGGDLSSSDDDVDGDKEKKTETPAQAAGSDSDSDNDAMIKRPTEENQEEVPSEDEFEAPEPEVEADPIFVNVPKTDIRLGSDPYYVKLPNFLTLYTQPFDPEFYEQENEDDGNIDEEGRMRLKLKCENTIRWRQITDEEGVELRESNAKFVRWSDGSMTLNLGAEMFDVIDLPIKEKRHLFVRQSAVLEGHAIFNKKMTFRPHSTDTMTHRKMTMNMAERSAKEKKTKIFIGDDSMDPQLAKRDTIRAEEQSLRATNRREGQQRRVSLGLNFWPLDLIRWRYQLGYDFQMRENYNIGERMSSTYLEPDSGDSDENLGNIKRQYREEQRYVQAGGSRSDDRLQRVKRIDSSDESGSDSRDAPSPAAKESNSKRRVVDDDDESD